MTSPPKKNLLCHLLTFTQCVRKSLRMSPEGLRNTGVLVLFGFSHLWPFQWELNEVITLLLARGIM